MKKTGLISILGFCSACAASHSSARNEPATTTEYKSEAQEILKTLEAVEKRLNEGLSARRVSHTGDEAPSN